MQDYKSIMCTDYDSATLLNIQTDRQHFHQLISRSDPTELKTLVHHGIIG